MRIKDFNKWDGQPRILTDEEIANPMMVVHEVFDYAHLPDLRNVLWEWLKTTISGNFNKKSLHYKDRESLLAFYEKMQKLLEAAHLLLLEKKIAIPGKADTLLSNGKNNLVARELAPAAELVPIIEKLTTILSPELIFEIGKIQEVNYPAPMYFFLVILSNTENRTYAFCQELAESACSEQGIVQLMTIKLNELQRYLKDGHQLYTPLCREDLLVYAKDNQPLPATNSLRLSECLKAAWDILDATVTKARAFYDGAIFYLQQGNQPLAVFMLQQAIEHTLRGFLHAVTGRNSVSHDLVTLRRHALPFFPELVYLLPVEKDNSICLLHKAGKAYVQARYESDFVTPVTEISQLKEWVENLLPRALEVFKERTEQIMLIPNA